MSHTGTDMDLVDIPMPVELRDPFAARLLPIYDKMLREAQEDIPELVEHNRVVVRVCTGSMNLLASNVPPDMVEKFWCAPTSHLNSGCMRIGDQIDNLLKANHLGVEAINSLAVQIAYNGELIDSIQGGMT